MDVDAGEPSGDSTLITNSSRGGDDMIRRRPQPLGQLVVAPQR